MTAAERILSYQPPQVKKQEKPEDFPSLSNLNLNEEEESKDSFDETGNIKTHLPISYFTKQIQLKQNRDKSLQLLFPCKWGNLFTL